MPGSEAVKKRMEELIAQSPELSQSNTNPHGQMAWLIAAQNALRLVCPSEANPYHVHTKSVVNDRMGRLEYKVSQVSALLRRLLEDIDRGLLTSIENHAIALTFDDFLDHGEEYLERGQKDEAGVIAGIVFEDTIRRVCRTLDITEKGVALETLIAGLTKREVLTALKAKRARAAAGLRASAAHARWEEFEISDVSPVIELTRELIEAHLG
jgi:hypothetical protein